MRIVLRYFLVFIVFFISFGAKAAPSTWYTEDGKNLTLNVSLFMSSTCPHCHKAEAFFKDIESKMPWIKVTPYFIDQDKSALILFNRFLNEQNIHDFAVPSIFFCNSSWIGFASEETTGKNLLQAFNYCKQHILKQGKINLATTMVLQHWANANLFNSNMFENPTPLKYTSWIALIDALSPCSLFSLIAFIVLLLIPSNSKGQIITGLCFIATATLAHLLQQVYVEVFYELFYWLRTPAFLTACFIFYFLWTQYKGKELYFLNLLLLSCLLGFFILAYQQTCLMNWAYVFQQWLTDQSLSQTAKICYQVIYQMIYMLPLVLILLLIVFLMKNNKLIQLKSKLSFWAWIYLMILGMILIFNPWILANGFWSVVMILTGGVLGLVLNKYRFWEKYFYG